MDKKFEIAMIIMEFILAIILSGMVIYYIMYFNSSRIMIAGIVLLFGFVIYHVITFYSDWRA